MRSKTTSSLFNFGRAHKWLSEMINFAENKLTMTLQEKKQKLVEKVQMVPENYYDDLNQLLDTILASEKQRNEKFDELLAKTSTKYKAVWEALS